MMRFVNSAKYAQIRPPLTHADEYVNKHVRERPALSSNHRPHAR